MRKAVFTCPLAGVLTVALLWVAVQPAAATEEADGLRVLSNAVQTSGNVDLTGVLVNAYQAGAKVEQTAATVTCKAGFKIRMDYTWPKALVGQVLVSNGTDRWFYDPARQTALRSSVGDLASVVQKKLASISSLPQVFKVKYFGIRTFQGRAAHVVQLVRKKEPYTYHKFWIDAERWVELGVAHYAADDTLITATYYESITYPSERPDDAQFEFTPPKGTRVISEPQVEFRSTSLEKVQQRVPAFKIRTPRYVPFGYVLQDISITRFRGQPVVWLRYTDLVNLVSIFERRRPLRAPIRDLTTPFWVVREGGALTVVAVGAVGTAILTAMADSVVR